MWKNPTPHAVFCAHKVHAEGRVSNRLNTELASSCSCTDKYIQIYVKIPVLESILGNTVSYVLSESKQFCKKLDVHRFIGCFVS